MGVLVLLDTNTITELGEGNPTVALNYQAEYKADIFIPIVAYKEVVEGWINIIQREKNKKRVYAHWKSLYRYVDVLTRHEIIPLSEDALKELERLPKGRPPIKEADRLIAACAMATGYVLVTSDRHFEQLLPQEQIVNWTMAPD